MRRIRGILELLAILLITGSLVVAFLTWTSHFYPGNRRMVVGPAGSERRAFTENCGFGDVTILLRASDWPRTFWQPVTLGELYWPEVQKSSNVVWSRDGTVVAFLRHLNEDQAPLFSAAYDYMGHRLIETGYDLEVRVECDRRISELLDSRGGMGPFQAGLDDEKITSEEYEPFPGWGFVTPILFVFAGVAVAWRHRHTSIRAP